MSEIGDVTMFFGTANGSARKALRAIEESHIMLSAVSEMGVPWDGIDNLFVDSGGYSLMLQCGEHPRADEYLDTVVEYEADLFAVQDYPCEPEILQKYGRSVREHQRRTTEATAECLVRAEERGIEAEPVAVVQGWTEEQYVEHARELRREGLLTDTVGIGSVCRRGQGDEIARIINRISSELPGRDLHAFGVKNSILRRPRVRKQLSSADTCAWYFRPGKKSNGRNDVDDTWQQMIGQYLEYRQKLAKLAGELHETDDQQSKLPMATTDSGRDGHEPGDRS